MRIKARPKYIKMLTENIVLQNTLEQIRHPLYGKKIKGQPKTASKQGIQNQWKAAIEHNKQNIKQLYESGKMTDWVACRTLIENDFTFEDEIYKLLINWLTTINWEDNTEVKHLFHYTEIVSNNNYKPNSLVLLKYHDQLVSIIKTLIKTPDFVIIQEQGKTFSKLVENIIELYFFHTSQYWNNKNHNSTYDDNRTEIADFIKDYSRVSKHLKATILYNEHLL